MHLIRSSLGLLAYFCAVFAQQVTFPGTLEVDLVFPRNDTYSPTRFFPFVFAIQNPLLANPLVMSFVYQIFSFGTTDGTNVSQAIRGEIDLRNDNLSTSDPYFAYSWTTDLNITEGAWGLTWSVISGNCSALRPESGYQTDVSFQNHHKFMVFSTKKGPQMPDLGLVATTDQGSCAANNQTQTYNVTGTLGTPNPGEYGGINSCAVLSSTSPSPAADPCRGKIDTAAASSISAAITAYVCAFPNPGVSCPPDPKPNYAVGKSLGGLGWLAVSIGWVTCLLLV